MKSYLREPLLYFLLIGGGMFVIFSVQREGDENEKLKGGNTEVIAINSAKIEHLSTLFQRTWQRPPTQQELQGLVDDFIREEIAYREALAAGLAEGDTIVRRRLRQKLEFFVEDVADSVLPSEEQLQEFYENNPDKYVSPGVMSFEQIFLNPEKRSEALEGDIERLLKALKEGKTTEGDTTLLGRSYHKISEREVANLFGREFLRELAVVPEQIWSGPVPSAYGAHLVYLKNLQAGSILPYEEVRDEVTKDWELNQREKMLEEYFARLREKYEITVEWPEEIRERMVAVEQAGQE